MLWTRIRILVVIAVAVLIGVEILFLRPSETDSEKGETRSGLFRSLQDQVETTKSLHSQASPKGKGENPGAQAKLPGALGPSDQESEIRYTMERFHYAAVEGQTRQWEILADRAAVVSPSQVIHAKVVTIHMYNERGEKTVIRADRAVCTTATRSFELFDHVQVTFPDGFVLTTTKGRYDGERKVISSQEEFQGHSPPGSQDPLQVWGRGFEAPKLSPWIDVLADARAKVVRTLNGEVSETVSKRARIERAEKRVHFFEGESPGPHDFVRSLLGTLKVRSRKQEMIFGQAAETTSSAPASKLKEMVALDDVLIEETDELKKKNGMKVAKSQRAEFLSSVNQIVLTGFPSAYQQNDTVVGDVIIVHRSRNVIEVQQANSFHQGKGSW